LFGRAVEWEWIDRIPARPKMLDEGNGRIVALSDEETGRLIQAAGASYDTDLILFVQIALGTSMRHGEILRVRWEHLDLANRRLYIPQAKAGARTQPITVSLADTLTREREMRVDRTGWIFPSRYRNSTIGHRESFEHSFRRAVIDAGLDPRVVTPHTLRHTAVTRLVQAGVDLPTIQAISGHKTIKMVLRYAHVSAPHVDEAMSALNADPVPVTRRAVSH
jgi:integrase